MRIIGGKYRSRRIRVPANLEARPTTDFAKEGLFNILSNRIDWEKLTALDLFAGTGSIAFELISRGAAYVVAVEKDPINHKFICKTQDELGAIELFPIKADVFKYLKRITQKFDLVFADPPYDLPQLETIPEIIIQKKPIKEGGAFVMEHPKQNDFSHLPYFREMRRYGNVHFSIFEF